MDWLVPLRDFLDGVEASPQRAHIALNHGTMRVLLYAPRGEDPQGPHKQDELYIIHTGKGLFRKGDQVTAFGPGDVIFVEAMAEHRFEDFTDDFAAWAVFWGPDGGES